MSGDLLYMPLFFPSVHPLKPQGTQTETFKWFTCIPVIHTSRVPSLLDIMTTNYTRNYT